MQKRGALSSESMSYIAMVFLVASIVVMNFHFLESNRITGLILENVCSSDSDFSDNKVCDQQTSICKYKEDPFQTYPCDPKTQPLPHYGTKNGKCLPSCGSAAGLQSICTNNADYCSGKQVYESYDCPICCGHNQQDCIATLKSCGKTQDAKPCVLQQYSNCQSKCIETCPTECNGNQCTGTNSSTENSTQIPQDQWKSFFFSLTIGVAPTSDNLRNVVGPKFIEKVSGTKVLTNAEGLSGKIQLPNGVIVDVIQGVGVGGISWQWLTDESTTSPGNCQFNNYLGGFDSSKFANPSHQTPKYKAARVFACQLSPQLTDSIISGLSAAGLNPTKLSKDVIDFNVEYEPGKIVGKVDVILAVEDNGIGAGWQWLPIDSGPNLTSTVPPESNDGAPNITSIDPLSGKKGITEIKIKGTGLTPTIQFINSLNQRYTVVGTLNPEKTQSSIILPNDLAPGNYKVRIYKSSDKISNELAFSVIDGGNYKLAVAIRTWNPYTINGWFPEISPNGKYISFGFGENFAADLLSGKEYGFGRGFPGRWIKEDAYYYQDDTDNTIKEVNVLDWKSKVVISDDTAMGNTFSAANGHWATGRANPGRIVYDGKVLIASGAGWGVSTSNGYLVHSLNNDGTSIQVWKDGQKTAVYPSLVPPHELSVTDGYIAYGGYGPIRGINPSGEDMDLSVTPWKGEGNAKVFFVNQDPWVASASFDQSSGKSFIFLRPWGEKKSIIIDGLDPAGLDVKFANDQFIVASNDPKGKLTVRWFSKDSERLDIANPTVPPINSTPSPKPTFEIVGQKNLGQGVTPDVVFFKNKVWLSVTQGNTVKLYSGSYDLSDLSVFREFSLGDGAGPSFSRLTVHDNVLWLAYKDGLPNFDIKLWRSDINSIESLGSGAGNDPMALGYGYIEWQISDGAFTIKRRNLAGGNIDTMGPGVPTGLSRILPDGKVKNIDEDRLAIPGVTRAWFSEDIAVAEGANFGTAVFFDNSHIPSRTLFEDEESFTPHAASDKNGNYAVVTWGGPGIRITTLKRVASTNPTCGNGIQDQNEQCDSGVQNGNCPSTCSLSCQINSCETSSEIPKPNHPLLYGYYYADGRYGDYTNEVSDYTNLYIAIPTGYDTSRDWRLLFLQSLQSASDNGKRILLLMDDESIADEVLDISQKFWTNIDMIEVGHEPSWTKEETEQKANSLKARIRSRNLADKPIGVTYTEAQFNTNSKDAVAIDWVGIEAYISASEQNTDSVNKLNEFLKTSKSKTQKKIMFIMMSYDRNGEWKNIKTLKDLQLPVYINSYNDEKVIAISMFSYARPGGARDHPELKEIQVSIGEKILGKPTLPRGKCIPSGTEEDINKVLNDDKDGTKAMLCKNAVFEISKYPVYFWDNKEEIFTEGYPTDNSRAVLKVKGDRDTAIMALGKSDVKLSNVIIDGNRRELGFKKDGGALIRMGGNANNQLVENVKAYDPRGWSVIHVFQSGGTCRNAIIRNNEFGPAGESDKTWADGISLSCAQSTVSGNVITDATDGGIVVFGSPGSIISGNIIITRNRMLLGGINLVDYEPFGGNYKGTVVENNVLIGEGPALMKIGIAMGPLVWHCQKDEVSDFNFGATVRNNIVKGQYVGYSYVVDGVSDWTVVGNKDESVHRGTPIINCKGNKAPNPAGFLKHSMHSSGQFQSEFQEGELDGIVGLES